MGQEFGQSREGWLVCSHNVCGFNWEEWTAGETVWRRFHSYVSCVYGWLTGVCTSSWMCWPEYLDVISPHWTGFSYGMVASGESDFLHNDSGLRVQVFRQIRQKLCHVLWPSLRSHQALFLLFKALTGLPRFQGRDHRSHLSVRNMSGLHCRRPHEVASIFVGTFGKISFAQQNIRPYSAGYMPYTGLKITVFLSPVISFYF